MKQRRSKKWYEQKIALEGDLEIGAGIPREDFKVQDKSDFDKEQATATRKSAKNSSVISLSALCGVLGIVGCLFFFVAGHYYRLHCGFCMVEVVKAEVEQAGGRFMQGLVDGDFYINLNDTSYDDEQFAKLCGQLHRFPPPHLDQKHRIDIDASNTNITDASVRLLKGLPVIAVKIRGTNITDDSVPVLSSLPLWHLNLAATQITDKSIEDLSKLQYLMVLDVRDTQISKEGLERLTEAFPYCDNLHTSATNDPRPISTSKQTFGEDGKIGKDSLP